MKRFRQSLPLLAITTLLLATGPAMAATNNVTATALQNLGAEVVDDNLGAAAFATTGQSTTSTTRRAIEVEATFSPDQPHHNDAIGSSRSSFTLWDIGNDAALSLAAAKAIDLNFIFHLTGITFLDQQTDGNGSYGAAHGYALSYAVSLFAGIGFVNTDGFTQQGCGGSTCSASLDQSMAGDFDFSFALPWHGATLVSNNGLLTMLFDAQAGGQASVKALFELESVVLTAGTAPLGGLALRFDQSGEFLPIVTAVPLPGTLWLFVAPLLMGVGLRRRDMPR